MCHNVYFLSKKLFGLYLPNVCILAFLNYCFQFDKRLFCQRKKSTIVEALLQDKKLYEGKVD